MQVIVARNSGFCSGVRKAVETAMCVPPENTFVYGEIIHNRAVVNELEKRGLITVDEVSKVPDGATLIIRSHGAEKSVYEECAKRNIRLIDCTCAFVKKSRDIVERASAEGKTLVITGSRNHPEICGLVGWTSGEVFVFSSPEEDFGVLSGKDVVLISQTTFSEKSFSKIAENIQKVRPKTVEIF
ncbi:MAG: bifunctional 4-hydroxy-3-methylbut-2-enyl diphosphate reductase/30S ribosomal protein S1, partial [Clostridia bacterium]|nr:bifunctional 4-hydroxy-3-methylbut-2-enyl diphosphate reductase/30S ribosomal protein S1 [Clostridia bacterium]